MAAEREQASHGGPEGTSYNRIDSTPDRPGLLEGLRQKISSTQRPGIGLLGTRFAEFQLRAAEAAKESGLQRDRAAAVEYTQGIAQDVPEVSLAMVGTKSAAKTSTGTLLGLALAYASDKTTTIFDGNPDGRVHIRLSYPELDDLVGLKKFASHVKDIGETTVSTLAETINNQLGKDPRIVAQEQAKALMPLHIEDIRLLKELRKSTPQGLGFVASSDRLTGKEAFDVMRAGRLISDYNIYDMGNALGDAEGDAYVRNIVNGVDILIYTVNVHTRDSWGIFADNMSRRMNKMIESSLSMGRATEAESLIDKRENSILVISGLKSGETDEEFLKRSSIAQFDENGVFINGIPFKGTIIGVPYDKHVATDRDFSLDELQTPTQIAYQELANVVLYNRYSQLYPEASQQ